MEVTSDTGCRPCGEEGDRKPRVLQLTRCGSLDLSRPLFLVISRMEVPKRKVLWAPTVLCRKNKLRDCG